MQKPTTNAITQGQHGNYNAVDYAASPDIDFYAPEDGTIVDIFKDPTCGNSMHLQGATGRHGFCHAEKYYVTAGQKVKRGQKIGKMGYTGYTIPAGPGGRHLHWVLNRSGVYVYPPSKVNQPFIKLGATMAMTATEKKYYDLGRKAEKGNWQARILAMQGATYTLAKANKIDPNFVKKMNEIV